MAFADKPLVKFGRRPLREGAGAPPPPGEWYDGGGTGRYGVRNALPRIAGIAPVAGSAKITVPFAQIVPTTFDVELTAVDQGGGYANRNWLESWIPSTVLPAAANGATVRVSFPTHNGSGVKINWGWDLGLPSKPDSYGHISFQSKAIKDGTFPRAWNQRVTASDRASMASFLRTTEFAAAGFDHSPAFWVSEGVRNWSFVGLECGYGADFLGYAPNQASALSNGFIALGQLYPSGGSDQYGPIGGNRPAVPASAQAKNCIIDRCELHGTVNVNAGRGLVMTGWGHHLRNSYIHDVGFTNSDAQGVSLGVGEGGHCIQNNRIVAALGESIMVGGGGILGEGPGNSKGAPDLVVTWNSLEQDLAWHALGWGHKNLFELKHGLRVLVYGNVLGPFRSDPSVQNQYIAVNFKMSADNGSVYDAANAVCQDITVRCNRFVDIDGGLVSFHGMDNYTLNPATALNKIEFSHNLLEPRPGGIKASNYSGHAVIQTSAVWNNPAGGEATKLRDLSVHHNTLHGPADDSPFVGVWFNATHNEFPNEPALRWESAGNVFAQFDEALDHDHYMKVTNGANTAAQDWALMTNKTDVKWGGNIVTGGFAAGALVPGTGGYPTDTVVANRAALMLGAGYAPSPGSPVLTADEAGGQAGADIVTLNAETAMAASGVIA